MIYTVTLNPAIDYVIRLNELKAGETNRPVRTEYIAGGKGINVSRMLKNLDVRSCALGFIAGHTGGMFEEISKGYGIDTDFIRLASGETRINVKLKSDMETEINAQGPVICENDEKKLIDKLSVPGDGDIIVLAGSVPVGMSSDIYIKIIKKFYGRNIKVIVDTSGKKLMDILQYHPFLVKPNLFELGELFGTSIKNREDAFTYGMELKKLGACNVIVSMGADGAVFIDENKVRYYINAPKGKVVNSVGAGDSMVAGFIKGVSDNKGLEHAFRLSVACGSASTFSCEFATKKEVNNIYNLLTLK